MFASTEHLIGGRASQLCDLYSLLCVAYYFIHKTLPWLSFIEDLQKKNPETNYYQKNRYKEIRITNRDKFDNQLYTCSGALSPLFAYVI